jgi:hypothetical protein
MEEADTRDRDKTQREVDERIDELMREGEEMEEKLDQAGSDADQVDVPEPGEESGPGIGASDLTSDDAGEPDDAESDD